MGGFGAGFAEALGQSFANTERMSLENNLQQRANLWNLHSKLLEDPTTTPETKLQVLKNMGQLASLPMNKKIPKELTDFSSLTQPPPGYGQQGAPTPAPSAPSMPGGEMVSPGTPPQQGGVAADLSGAGGAHGQSLPLPPPGFTGPQYAQTPGPETGEPLMGFGPQAAPAPPPYQPHLQYTPQELAHMQAAAEAEQAGGRVTAEIQARKEQMPPNLSAPDQARWLLGQGPLAIHAQTKLIVDPSNTNQAMYANFDPVARTYTDPDTGEIIEHPIAWTASSGVTTPWKAFLDAGLAANKPIEQIVNEYNTHYSQQTGFKVQVNPDGSTELVPFTSGAVRTQGGAAPGTANAPAAPGAALTGPPQGFGGKMPPVVETAFTNLQDAQARLETMQGSLQAAKEGDSQAMLNILWNHLGMTGGMQKGARITQTSWEEAMQSAPFLDRILSHFFAEDPQTHDRTLIEPLSGVTLTPKQMDSMISLAQSRLQTQQHVYDSTVKGLKAYNAAPPPPMRGKGASPAQTTGHKVGDIVIQNGVRFKATQVDKDGKVTAADPA